MTRRQRGLDDFFGIRTGVSVAYTYDQLNRLATGGGQTGLAPARTQLPTRRPGQHLATGHVIQTASSPPVLGYRHAEPIDGADDYGRPTRPNGQPPVSDRASGRTANWSYDRRLPLDQRGRSRSIPTRRTAPSATAFDPVGNRCRRAQTLPASLWAVSGYRCGRPDDLTETYDNNGKHNRFGRAHVRLRLRDRLKSINGTAVTLIYDGDGNRVAKAVEQPPRSTWSMTSTRPATPRWSKSWSTGPCSAATRTASSASANPIRHDKLLRL